MQFSTATKKRIFESSKLVPLKELGEIVSGSTPKTQVKEYWNGDIPWITPADLTNHSGVFFKGSLRKITKAGLDSCSTRILPQGSILFSSRAPIGHCAVTAFPLCTNQGFKSLIPNPSKLDPVYGFFALSFFTPEIVALGRGATFSEINKEIMENFAIPLPLLEEQKRIAAIAQKCDRLRRTRRFTQQLSDTYIQSVFIKMFGGENSKSWDHVRVSDLAKSGKNRIRTGPFGSQLLHEEFQPDGEIAVLGIDNVVQNFFVWDKKRFITPKKYQELKRYTVFPGDVLITIMGTCGRCAVVPDSIPLAINTKHLCCISLDQNRCLPTYLQHFFLRHPLALEQLGISERGAVMPGLNMGLIKDLIMPLPPLYLQEKFAQVVQRFERLRAQQREGDRQAEHLFLTVLHRAFRGEL
jgi:type I restriction enzyme S subunit